LRCSTVSLTQHFLSIYFPIYLYSI